MMPPLTAEEVARLLRLAPHPEGGFFRETFRDASPAGGRGRSTAIYYLLRGGEVSAWHRVTDAAEVWHFYAGSALELTLWAEGGAREILPLRRNAAGVPERAVIGSFEPVIVRVERFDTIYLVGLV